MNLYGFVGNDGIDRWDYLGKTGVGEKLLALYVARAYAGIWPTGAYYNAKQVAESTMVAIMGRMSAYTGQLVRWSDVMNNEDSEFYKYACQPTAVDFESGTIVLPAEVPPVPGR